MQDFNTPKFTFSITKTKAFLLIVQKVSAL